MMEINAKNVFLIGIGSTSRVGKDTLAKYLFNKFHGHIDISIFSLAYELKKQMEQFIQDKLSLNVWTDNSEEKAIFRSLLVEYGKIQRIKSNGKYWTEILDKKIKNKSKSLNYKPFIIIVPDIRYCEYPEDEVYWVQDKWNGILINIDRIQKNGTLIPPANRDEAKNSEIIKKYSDYNFIWPSIEDFGESYIYNNYFIPFFDKLFKEYENFLNGY